MCFAETPCEEDMAAFFPDTISKKQRKAKERSAAGVKTGNETLLDNAQYFRMNRGSSQFFQILMLHQCNSVTSVTCYIQV